MTPPDDRPPTAVPVALDELPRYSPWPARLLQAGEGVAHPKDRNNVLREFDQDKWGLLLDRLKACGCADLPSLERLISPPDQEQLYSDRGALFRAPANLVQERYLDYLTHALRAFGPVECMAELGGGAGNLVLRLARDTVLARRWISYELTENGRRVTELVAAAEGVKVAARHLDFDAPADCVYSEPRAATVYFSSFALAYCRDPYAFLGTLVDDDSTAGLLLIEPIYQLLEESSLLALLGRRYLHYNDYSTALWPAVQRLAQEGRVEIRAVDANFFGHNALCPVSSIQLLPRRR